MAPALVGTIGTAVQGTSGNSVSPSFGASENRTAGNLLILFCTVTGTATLPTTPTGWIVGKQVAGTSCSATIFFKPAEGSDSAPTVAGITSGLIAAQLAEYSGVVSGTVNQSGSATATSSPVTATNAGADTVTASLQLTAGADRRSVARASNDTWTGNHVTTFTAAGNNNGTSSTDHYSFAYSNTNSNSGADTAIMTLSITTSITGLAVVDTVFKPGVGTFSKFAQAQVKIKATTQGFAQSNAYILNGHKHAQARVYIIPPTINYPELIRGDSPDAFYRLSEPSGSTMTDQTGAHTGSYVGTPTYGTVGATVGDPNNTAITLDGSGSAYGEVSGYTTIPAKPVTLEAWIQHNGVDFTLDCAIAGWQNNTGDSLALQASTVSGSVMRLGIYTDTGNSHYDWTPAGDTGWHHIVGYISSDSTPHFFFDGVDVGTASSTTFVGGSSVNPFRVGTTNDAGVAGTESWPGGIDEVAVYPVQLTTTQIMAHYRAGRNNGTTTRFASGQAQAKINAFGVQAYSQAQTRVRFYGGNAQAQASINQPNPRQYAQALATLKTPFRFAQAACLVNGAFTSVTDTFTRSVTDGMGTADVGGAWTRKQGAAADYDVDGTELVLTKTTTSEYITSLDTALMGLGTGRVIGIKFAWAVDHINNGTPAIISVRFGVPSRTVAAGTSGISFRLSANNANTVTPSYTSNALLIDTSVGIPFNYNAFNYVHTLIGITSNNEYRIKYNINEYSDTDNPGFQWDEDVTVSGSSVNTDLGHIELSIAGLVAGDLPDSFFIDDFVLEYTGWSVPAQAQVQIKQTYKGFAQAHALITNGLTSDIQDTFTRSVTDSFGTADTGGAWERVSGTAADFDVNGSAGTITNAITGAHVVRLPALSPTRFNQVYLEYSLSALPATGSITITPQTNRGTPNEVPVLSFVEIDSAGTVNIKASLKATTDGVGFNAGTYNAGETWVVKQAAYEYGTYTAAFAKTWKLGTAEPNWQNTLSLSITDYLKPGHFRFEEGGGGTGAATLTLDNLNVTGYLPQGYAQAKAAIKAVSNGFAQAQAKIPGGSVASNGFAQAQTDVKATSNAFAQAQTDVKAISWGFAQSQADIKATSSAFSQAQADIKATSNGFAQANADIKATSFAFSQSQADIKAISSVFAQAQADIKQTYNGFAQAQTDVKAIGRGFAQSQADIKAISWGFAQSQADIKAVSWGFANAQADIKQTYNGFAQSQADIKQTSFGFAQAQTKIIPTRVFSQAQADIKAVSWGFAQAQADIKATSFVFAQSQADIKQTYNGFAQGQADIKQTYNGFAQSQADIKATSWGFAQAQCKISTTRAYAQAQADIKAVSWGFAQAQADVKAIGYGFGQAQANIRVISNSFAQAQADVKATSFAFSQAQADIKQIYQGYAQSQADIKQTYQGYAQAQTWIRATYSGFAQAQADVKAVGYGFANAQADIKAISYGFAQAQADINTTYQGYAQAQTWIEQTYNGFAQSQADIKATSYGFSQAQAKLNAFGVQGYAQAQAQIQAGITKYAQAQAKIKTTATAEGSNPFGQAQADIKAISRGFSQAQADILVTTSRFAQAQADIKVTTSQFAQAQAKLKAFGVQSYAQSQADIKAKSSAFSQAQADIKVTTSVFAQAQADILVTTSRFAQAQADIKATSYGFAQAQSDIKAKSSAFSQAQTDVKAISRGFAQAQASIVNTNWAFAQAQCKVKATSNGYAQAQCTVKATSWGFGQANADIKAIGYGFGQAQGYIQTSQSRCAQAQAYIKVTDNEGLAQAQAQIKQTYSGFGQAQTDVKQTYTQSANAQAAIKTSVNNYAQAQSQIKQTYQGYAQAQASILTGGYGFGQATVIVLATYQGYAQANAAIIKAAGYAQAQAYIFQPFVLSTVTVSDAQVLSITLSDVSVNPSSGLTDITKLIITLTDVPGLSLTLTDVEHNGIELTLSDGGDPDS